MRNIPADSGIRVWRIASHVDRGDDGPLTVRRPRTWGAIARRSRAGVWICSHRARTRITVEHVMKILIAEDDAVSAKILQFALESAGHSVMVATCGEEAWTVFDREPVRVIVS